MHVKLGLRVSWIKNHVKLGLRVSRMKNHED